MAKIMQPEDVPPEGSVIYFDCTNGRGRSWSVVVHTVGFGGAQHLTGADEIFNNGTYSTVGCVHVPDANDWPEEVCVALAKFRLVNG